MNCLQKILFLKHLHKFFKKGIICEVIDYQQKFNKGQVIDFEVPTVVLASNSPRRAKVLTGAGIDFVKIIGAVKEEEEHKKYKREGIELEHAVLYANAVAYSKMRSLVGRIKNGAVVTADTVVWCDGRVIEKPLTKEKCAEQHRFLMGKTNYAITAVAVYFNGKSAQASKNSKVKIKKMPEEVIEAICNEPEALDAAGYAYNDKTSAIHPYFSVRKCQYNNMLGLDIKIVKKLLKKVGFKLA